MVPTAKHLAVVVACLLCAMGGYSARYWEDSMATGANSLKPALAKRILVP